MKKITNYELRITRVAFCFLLSAFCLLLFCSSALYAQSNENRLLDSVSIQKNELVVTPEITKIVIDWFNNWPDTSLSYYGIKNKMQLELLHLGKPIPNYKIVNEEFKSLYNDVNIDNATRMSDNAILSLRFTNNWAVPVMYDEEPLSFGLLQISDYRGYAFMGSSTNKITELFLNYENKDLIIGSLNVRSSMTGMDYLIIQKENKEIFVEVYDDESGEYYKNEYNFSELINRLKELNLRKKEVRNRYYAQVANKTELEITPKITEMLDTTLFSRLKDWSVESLSDLGIKNKAQLEHLNLGKSIPMYRIVDDILTFTGYWKIPVSSAVDPLFIITVVLEIDGQYRRAGYGGASIAETIYNYEHKDLIIGCLEVIGILGMDYLIIQRDNKNIFVKMYDYSTREYLKNEYSFSELLNYLKK